MGKTILVIPDQHAHPDFNNDRAVWLGKFIKETKPDVVVNLGDCADMFSLSSYDKGKASFRGNSYEKDIQAHLDFQEKLWLPAKLSKKKRPYSVVLIGNHEQRLQKVLDYDSHLSGDKYGISFKDYDFESYYDEVVPYSGETPGIWTYEGVSFAHFFSTQFGKAMGGEHHAYNLLAKNYSSCVCGHSHMVDLSVKTQGNGRKIMGLVAGVYQDYRSSWAGHTQDKWWRGVVVLRGVEDGSFDPQFVSVKALKEVYHE